MSDPHSPKFIIAPCEAATIKPSIPHHNTAHFLELSHFGNYYSFSNKHISNILILFTPQIKKLIKNEYPEDGQIQNNITLKTHFSSFQWMRNVFSVSLFNFIVLDG